MKLRLLVLPPILVLVLALAACSEEKGTADDSIDMVVLMATTTSTENSGLLGYLEPKFEEDTGYDLQYTAVGTGQALEMGRNGDVDVLLVHAKERELQFVADGYGVDRREIMYNDFVVVGPESDPAGIKRAEDVGSAFAMIADAEAAFVSRGDDSGTNNKELSIWEQALSGKPSADWYLEAGQGMGAVLRMASEQQAYTLSDRATYLALRDELDLEILFEGDPLLFNQYGVIAVNPEKYPDVNYEGAMAFINWICSEKGQQLINEFGVDEYGQALFTANYSQDK